MSWSLRVKLLVTLFASVTIGAVTAWWTFPPTAAASNCQNITNAYNSVATNNMNTSSAFGVRNGAPGMKTYGMSALCTHVSSIWVFDSNSHWAEVGWLISLSGHVACAGHVGDNTPHVFWTYEIFTAYTCHEDDSIALNVGSSYTLSTHTQFASNGIPTGTWTYSFNTHDIDTPTLGFDSGASQTNGERHNSSESAQALFDGMQFYNSSQSWVGWGNSECWYAYSDDPGYHNQLLSHTKVQVTSAAEQC